LEEEEGRRNGVIAPLLISFVLFLLLAAPVSIAMGLAAVIAIGWQGKVPLNTVVTQMVSGMDSFPLMAIPFFILAGELMERAGISERLVTLAKALVGHIRGGLGMVVILAEYLFSGISGSTAADVSAIGSLLIAPMERAGYSKGESVAIVSAATAMGILVPPCIFMIVLASMTNQSIGAMFVAGFLPAVVIALGLIGLVYWKARRLNIPREPRASLRRLLKAAADGIIAMIMPGIIFGSIFGGITTVT
jgi:C4-dicarboxylate transporter DctM subunit